MAHWRELLPGAIIATVDRHEVARKGQMIAALEKAGRGTCIGKGTIVARLTD